MSLYHEKDEPREPGKEKAGDIPVRYYEVDGDKLDEDKLNQCGNDVDALYAYLKTAFEPVDVYYSPDAGSIDLHQEGIVEIDLRTMPRFPKLWAIVLGYNYPLHRIDLGPLANCKNLEELAFDQCRLVRIDLSPLANCPKFHQITFRDNFLQEIDLSPFKHCKDLLSIDLDWNFIEHIDLAPLAGCPKLEYLALDGNPLRELDVSPLANCKALKTLYIDSTHSKLLQIDLSPLASCSELEDVRIDANVRVIEPPGGFKMLHKNSSIDEER